MLGCAKISKIYISKLHQSCRTGRLAAAAAAADSRARSTEILNGVPRCASGRARGSWSTIIGENGQSRSHTRVLHLHSPGAFLQPHTSTVRDLGSLSHTIVRVFSRMAGQKNPGHPDTPSRIHKTEMPGESRWEELLRISINAIGELNYGWGTLL